MDTTKTWADIDEALRHLPGCDDALFKNLWLDGKLRYSDDSRTDNFDLYSARLVCAACVSSKNLLISLPDNSPHRPALMFATALLRNWHDVRSQNGQNASHRPVLYFGSDIQIRKHLADVRLRGRGVDLAEVFQQRDVGRSGKAVDRNQRRVRADSSFELPRVITVYSPADPVHAVDRYRPTWVAVDVNEAPNLNWLEALLKHSKRSNTAVIAWGSNPMSECVSLFKQYGETWVWPLGMFPMEYTAGKPTEADTWLEGVFSNGASTSVQPLELRSSTCVNETRLRLSGSSTSNRVPLSLFITWIKTGELGSSCEAHSDVRRSNG